MRRRALMTLAAFALSIAGASVLLVWNPFRGPEDVGPIRWELTAVSADA